jgi:hypothetical protein
MLVPLLLVQLPCLSAETERPPFSVLWNSPWPGCCGHESEGVLLPAANPPPQFVENNVTVNAAPDPHQPGCKGTSSLPCFNGPKVITIYEAQTGLYPKYVQDKTTKEWTALNGGLPQSANLSAHLARWETELVGILPDAKANPVVSPLTESRLRVTESRLRAVYMACAVHTSHTARRIL